MNKQLIMNSLRKQSHLLIFITFNMDVVTSIKDYCTIPSWRNGSAWKSNVYMNKILESFSSLKCNLELRKFLRGLCSECSLQLLPLWTHNSALSSFSLRCISGQFPIILILNYLVFPFLSLPRICETSALIENIFSNSNWIR